MSMSKSKKENWTRETKTKKPQIKLFYRFEDIYGQRLGEFETNKLASIENPTAEGTVYFNGSVKSSYSDFIIECKIFETKND